MSQRAIFILFLQFIHCLGLSVSDLSIDYSSTRTIIAVKICVILAKNDFTFRNVSNMWGNNGHRLSNACLMCVAWKWMVFARIAFRHPWKYFGFLNVVRWRVHMQWLQNHSHRWWFIEVSSSIEAFENSYCRRSCTNYRAIKSDQGLPIDFHVQIQLIGLPSVQRWVNIWPDTDLQVIVPLKWNSFKINSIWSDQNKILSVIWVRFRAFDIDIFMNEVNLKRWKTYFLNELCANVCIWSRNFSKRIVF